MENTSWLKQTKEAPLFQDLLWSRPENRQHAGKLLIIGGNLHGFSAAGEAYNEANKAGIGACKVLLPDALQKTVGRMLDHGEFAPSTPSGSFSKQALASWLDWSGWSDGMLIAGDLGRNSETAVTIETFMAKTTAPIIITKDAIDYFYSNPDAILNRPETTLVLSIAQLQKLTRGQVTVPIQFSFGIAQTVEWLRVFTEQQSSHLVTYHQENIIVAVNGQVSTTHVGGQESWRVKTAAHAAVWLLQNPQKPFEAITTSVID